MSSERVDLDRLADFVGGALDGTPEADAVRRLIAADPAWAEAYTEFVVADAAVRTDLGGYAAHAPPMPADVAHRLEAVLRTVDGPSRSGPTTRDPEETGVAGTSGAEGHEGSGPGRVAASDSGPGRGRAGRTGPGVPGPGRRPPSGAHSGAHSGGHSGARGATRRRARWMAALSAAAAVIAVGVGLTVLVPQLSRPASESAGTAADASQREAGGAAPTPAGGPAQIASGRNYRPGDFDGLAAGVPNAAAPGAGDGTRKDAGPPGAADQRSEARAGTAGEPTAVPGELTRLLPPAARQACLDAIQGVHGGTAVLVDYARFDDRPALIVLLAGSRTGAGDQWVVVAGPDCGRMPGVTDERYNGPAA